MRKDFLDPLLYTECFPSLMSASGRVDAHSVVAHYLMDNKMIGDYLEFGVGMGRSAVAAIRAYSRTNVIVNFHLFDSFCGLPKFAGPDMSSNQFQEGDYSYNEESVKEFLVKHSVWDKGRVLFHRGWFNETVDKWCIAASKDKREISVIHLDMDLYESCATVLKSIRPLLKTGIVFMFDDWNCFKASNAAGERKATLDWLRVNRDVQLDPWFTYGWHGQSFFCQVE
jgi:O-methyltransferase